MNGLLLAAFADTQAWRQASISLWFMLLGAEGGCGSSPWHPPQGKRRGKVLGGGGFGSSPGCSRPEGGPFAQSPCSLVPTAEEVMARLVNLLIPLVEEAREWLKKTELHLKEDGKESFILGRCSGSHGSRCC